MGKPLVKLVQGQYSLDLNDQSRYWLSQDFTPPPASVAPIFTGINGDLFDTQESNRAFTFTVAITGSSSGQIDQAVRAIQSMLKRAGDLSNPLYLVYKASDTVPDPLWGQFGSRLRYEIVHGDVTLSDGYMVGVRRSTDINVTINLTLKPYALGIQQRLCSAMGGILEDTLGYTDGLSRGLIAPEATTNVLSNPVFENDTTGWSTTGAGTSMTRITTQAYIGRACVLIFKPASVSGGIITTYTTATGGSWTGSAHVKAYDANDVGKIIHVTVRVNYADASIDQTNTTITLTADWQRASVTQAANGAKTVSSVQLFVRDILGTANAHYFLADACQLENKEWPTPFGYGDLLGWTWAGTAHASTSSRVATVCKLPVASDTFVDGPFSIRLVIKTPIALGTAEMELIDLRDGGHTTALRFYLASGTTPTLTFNAGTVTLSALAANTVYVFHVTYNGTTLTFYRNGASGGTSNQAPVVSGANLYWGSDYSGAAQFAGKLLYPATFDQALTSTQIATDYAELSPLVTAGMPAESLPWLWTKDGDGTVDNYYDATHHMHSVCGGVPGTSPAITKIVLTTDENSSSFNLYQSLYAVDTPVDVSDFFDDDGGTVDAAALGGAASVVNVSTGSVFILGAVLWKNFKGGEFAYLVRAKDAGSNLKLSPLYLSGAISIQGAEEASKFGAGYGLQILTPQYIDYFPETPGIYLSLLARRTTGSGNFSIDYNLMLPGKICVWQSLSNGYNIFDYDSQRTLVYLYNLAGGSVYEANSYLGDPIELLPNKYNYLFAHVGGAATSTLTRTMTYSISVIPRYGLL